MTYRAYVLDECKRQWAECQSEIYGSWDSQTEAEQKAYFLDMYQHLWLRRVELVDNCIDVPDTPEYNAWNLLKADCE